MKKEKRLDGEMAYERSTALSSTICSVKSLLISICLFGCALPPERGEKASWVPKVELQGVDLVQQGLDYYSSGRLVEAELKLTQARQLFPDAHTIDLNLSVILEKQERYDEAEELILNLLKLYPDTPKYLMALARIHASDGSYDKAITEYRALITRFEREQDQIYVQQKQTERAGEKFVQPEGKEYLAQLPDLYRSLHALYYLIGDESEALCASYKAYSLRANAGELYKHVRLINGMNYAVLADSILSTREDAEFPKGDQNLIFQHLLAEAALNKLDEVQKILKEATVADISDPSLKLSFNAMLELYPLPEDEKKDDESEDDKDESKESDEPIITALQELKERDDESLATFVLYYPGEIATKLIEAIHAAPDKDEGNSWIPKLW